MRISQKTKSITIAVLPFQVVDLDQRITTFFHGFTEDLISNFSKFIGLSVISSFSTLQIKDVYDQTEIEKLGADYLIYGTVRPLRENLRISIQLVKSADQNLVFAAQHDQAISSLLEAQDGIVQQIVSVLQEKINYNLLSHSYRKSAVDLAAYENYLLGMDVLRKGTAESDVKAREIFHAALKIDPQFSLAYTGLSLSYFNFWSCLLWHRWDDSHKGAHKYALKAIEIDPNDYTALGVLGRTYAYLEEYEKAEHCLRKSLRMNPSDTSHLLRVAYSLTYLGYPKESVELYEKALLLNPFHGDSYYAYGASFYLESGDFEASISLSKKVNFDVWIDFPACVAAAYFQVGDEGNMWKCWKVYLEQFQKHIYTSDKPMEAEALTWLKTINPYRGFSYLDPLIDHIRSQKGIVSKAKALPPEPTLPAQFRQSGDVWNLRYQNKSLILKDAKGFHDIHRLMAEPSKEIHCLELMNAAVEEASPTFALDEKAKREYQNRIQTLQEEIQEAEDLQHLETVGKLREEYDSILSQLSNSLGLSGKSRKVGSTTEKARSAVTWRIRSTIKKIKEQHPALATHLSKSIKTGTFCAYLPENQILWDL